MDLSLWSTQDYHATAFMLLRMSFGAKPYRCEYCRLNFVSFRRRREKFTFKRWAKTRQAATQNRQAAQPRGK
jgi:hypothetical protein